MSPPVNFEPNPTPSTPPLDGGSRPKSPDPEPGSVASLPEASPPRKQSSFARLTFAAVLGGLFFSLVLFGAYFLAGYLGIAHFVPSTQSDKPLASAAVTQPTEAFFLNGLKSQPFVTDEWWAARSDHRLVAYSVLTCKDTSGNLGFDRLPLHVFSALLLDLDPAGNHVFQIKEGDDRHLAERDKNGPPVKLSLEDRELLALSDSIARARIAAAQGASTNMPWVQGLGLTTLITAALATLFVTLQGRMRPIDLEDQFRKELQSKPFWVRVRVMLFGPGCGFRWVAFFAIALSIAGTSLTGLKQVYDPTRTLTQNTRALLDLRQLHQEVITGIRCVGDKASTKDNRFDQWVPTIRRIRATIIPDYGAYTNLDVGGSSQRPDPTVPTKQEENNKQQTINNQAANKDN